MRIAYETSDFGEALVCRAKLEQAGVLVHMDNYNWGCAEPYMGFALGYRLWVPECDLNDSSALLNQAKPIIEDVDPIDICPNCGSDQVVRFRSILWLFIHWFLGVYLAVAGGNRRRCIECKHTFKTKGPAITGPFKFLILVGLVYVAFLAGAGYIWLPAVMNFPQFTH